jgi:hypothetical protein
LLNIVFLHILQTFPLFIIQQIEYTFCIFKKCKNAEDVSSSAF